MEKGSINPLELSPCQGAAAGEHFPKDRRGKGCWNIPQLILPWNAGAGSSSGGKGCTACGAESLHRKKKELLKGAWVPYIIPWKKPARTWVGSHRERQELPRRSWSSRDVPPASPTPGSIPGNSAAGPELLQKPLSKAKPLLLLGLSSYFWSPDLIDSQGYTSNRPQGYF